MNKELQTLLVDLLAASSWQEIEEIKAKARRILQDGQGSKKMLDACARK